MQQNPVQRTLRLIIFSIGFVLFVMLAFRSASQISDPRFIKGKPFLFAKTQSASFLSADAAAASMLPAAKVAAVQTATPAPAPPAPAQAVPGADTVATNHHAVPHVTVADEHDSSRAQKPAPGMSAASRSKD